MDKTKQKYLIPDSDDRKDFADPLFKIRGPVRKVTVFRQMITDDLIRLARKAAEDDNPAVWTLPSYHHIPTSIGFFLQVLAVTVRIFALQNTPTRSDKSVKKKLRGSIEEARTHFIEKYGKDGAPPCMSTFECAFSRFLFHRELFDTISKNFQEMFEHVGEFAAGDEKLHKFKGNSRDIMHCPSKPDKIGLWNYQLCTMLGCGLPFLLDLFQKLCTEENVEHVVNIVMRWCEILFQYFPSRAFPTLLAFDMYYMSSATRAYVSRAETRDKVVVVASCKQGMFKHAETKLKDVMVATERIVTKPGEWCGIYNPDTQESLTKVFDTLKGVGVKLNYSTALVEQARKGLTDTEALYLKGAYDYYKLTFSACDDFNTGLCGKKWPHKSGGNHVRGDEHHQHTFLMSCLLQNTIAAFTDINGIEEADRQDFKTFCIELGDEIYAESLEHLNKF